MATKPKRFDNRSRPHGGQQRGGGQRGPQSRGKGPRANGPAHAAPTAVAAPEKSGVVELPPVLTVKELADALDVSPAQVIKELMKSGIMATINQRIDFETAAIVAADLGVEVQEAPTTASVPTVALPETPRRLVPRPPVVTAMGHVDHGKTSLLDAIRQTNVVATEAGGITQHIGAYQVEVQGRKITFLDTPGHEAFTALRARGAQVTDIVILVVAADDGVMPQTREAIAHAQAAGVPIVVALNKIDKPNANPQRVKTQLAEVGLVPVEFGGDVEVVPVSAKQRIGIDQLLEVILAVADLQELRADPDRPASGTVIEAKLDKARGPVATVLVQEGTLRVGDVIIVGPLWGKVKALFNDRGKRIKQAEPSTPVEVLGLNGVPSAGDRLQVVPDEKTARTLAEAAQREAQKAQEQMPPLTLQELLQRAQESETKELNVVVKADVQGSLEAILATLPRLEEETGIRPKVLYSGVGNITESDVMLASTANGIVIGFNVRQEPGAQRVAASRGTDVRVYNVIYELVDDVRKALRGMLEPRFQEIILGRAEVRQLFRVGKGQVVAGSFVTEGKVVRGAAARVLREGQVVYDGRIDTLRRFKEDAKEVATGYECGILLDGFRDLQEGDVIEVYGKEQVG
ncbi:MAG TPA: translation initiation factor IF-2 [Chloroflexota bacterium]